MKSIVFSILFMASGYCWGADYNILADTIIDTTYVHSVKQIDEHLVIQDSIFIERTIERVKKEAKEYESGDPIHKIVAVSVIALVLLSFINHYFKRKKNG
jgi:hypothetical protein